MHRPIRLLDHGRLLHKRFGLRNQGQPDFAARSIPQQGRKPIRGEHLPKLRKRAFRAGLQSPLKYHAHRHALHFRLPREPCNSFLKAFQRITTNRWLL